VSEYIKWTDEKLRNEIVNILGGGLMDPTRLEGIMMRRTRKFV